MDRETARRELAELVAEWGDDLPLERAVALIAAEENPDVDPDALTTELDTLSRGVRMPPSVSVFEATARLNHYLFDACGFSGDETEYDDPRNSMLDQVLERRRGLPITLSVVYIAVAARVGLDVDPIGFPTHFLVSPREAEPRFFVDAFHGGRILREDVLLERLEEMSGGGGKDPEQWLAPITHLQVVTRMSLNLKGSYLRRGAARDALRQVERLLLLHPDDEAELRDRDRLRARLGER